MGLDFSIFDHYDPNERMSFYVASNSLGHIVTR